MAVTAGRGVATGRAQADHTSGRSAADVSQREDLANFISMITRDETPFLSSIGKTKASAIFHEWQTDELNAPIDSRVYEGSDYQVPASAVGDAVGNEILAGVAAQGGNRTRLGNYTQINGKMMAVSGTRRAIDQAGVADEYAYQLKKRGTEMRRDMEHSLIHTYQVSSANDPRKTGGFQAWINDARTCEFVGTGFAAPGTPRAGSATIAGGGTNTGALSLSSIDAVMQKIYEEGGKASKIMVSPKLRRDFSDLMVTDSGVRRNIDMDGKLRQSVDIYMSDFGDLMVVPNYVMGLSYTTVDTTGTDFNAANSCALVYDPQWFAFATLRPMQEVEVGQRGDSTVGMMVEEWSLEVKNPLGCGAIYGLS